MIYSLFRFGNNGQKCVKKSVILGINGLIQPITKPSISPTIVEDMQPTIHTGSIELITAPTIQSVAPPSSSRTSAQTTMFNALKSGAKQEPDLSLEEKLMLSDGDESLISSCPPPPPPPRIQAKDSTNTNEKRTAILIDIPLVNPCQRKRTRPLKLKPYKKIKTSSSEKIHTTQSSISYATLSPQTSISQTTHSPQTSISQPTHTPQTSTKSTPESINKPHLIVQKCRRGRDELFSFSTRKHNVS